MRWLRFLVLLFLLPLAACAVTPSTYKVDTTGPYRLNTGDVLRVTVYGDTSLSTTYKVDDSGAVVTLNTSWDVWKHGHAPIELYGEEGTLFVPDPNFFGGVVSYTKRSDLVKKLPKWKHLLQVPNQVHSQGAMANYRTVGLADMAVAIQEGRPHRCSMELALHAAEVMTGILRSGESGKFVAMKTT